MIPQRSAKFVPEAASIFGSCVTARTQFCLTCDVSAGNHIGKNVIANADSHA